MPLKAMSFPTNSYSAAVLPFTPTSKQMGDSKITIEQKPIERGIFERGSFKSHAELIMNPYLMLGSQTLSPANLY